MAVFLCVGALGAGGIFCRVQTAINPILLSCDQHVIITVFMSLNLFCLGMVAIALASFMRL